MRPRSELKAFLKGLLEGAAREPRLYVRFADAARHAWHLARSASEPGSDSVTPPWVLVPEALHEDTEALGPWVREAHAQAPDAGVGAPLPGGQQRKPTVLLGTACETPQPPLLSRGHRRASRTLGAGAPLPGRPLAWAAAARGPSVPR